MKLLRYGNPGFELPGALDSDGNIRDLSGLVSDIDGDSLASITVQDIDLSGLPIVAEARDYTWDGIFAAIIDAESRD